MKLISPEQNNLVKTDSKENILDPNLDCSGR